MKRWERYKKFADNAMEEQAFPWVIFSILWLWISISLVMTSPSVLVSLLVGTGAALIWILFSIILVPFIIVWMFTARSNERKRKAAEESEFVKSAVANAKKILKENVPKGD